MDDLLPEKKDYRFAFMPEKETTPESFLEYIDEIVKNILLDGGESPEIVLSFGDKKLELTFCPEVMEKIREAIAAEKEYWEED